MGQTEAFGAGQTLDPGGSGAASHGRGRGGGVHGPGLACSPWVWGARTAIGWRMPQKVLRATHKGEGSHRFTGPQCGRPSLQSQLDGMDPPPPPAPCDIPSGCGFFTGPWTVTRSSLRMLRRVAAFCRPLRPVLLLVSFPRSRSPVVGVPGLC